MPTISMDDSLRKSAFAGDIREMERALSLGADPLANESEALHMAVIGGHAVAVEFLMGKTNPSALNSLALATAAESGRLDLVSMLIPVSCPEESMALAYAARNGHLACVLALLPHSDAEMDDSVALRWSLKEGRADCAEILFPLSDAEKVRCSLAEAQDEEALSFLGMLSERHSLLSKVCVSSASSSVKGL